MPRSFDSPLARSRMFDGNLDDRQSLPREAQERLHLGRAARVGLGEDRQRLRVDGVEAARRVVERPAERHLHPAPEQAVPKLRAALGS